MPGKFLAAPLIVWIGEFIIQTTGGISKEFTGSGDDTMAWLSFLQCTIAVTGTFLWTVITSKRPSYSKLLHWFALILRVYAVFFMVVHGMVKVFEIYS